MNLRGTGMELGPEFEKRLEKEAFCSGKLEVRFRTAAPPSQWARGARSGALLPASANLYGVRLVIRRQSQGANTTRRAAHA